MDEEEEEDDPPRPYNGVKVVAFADVLLIVLFFFLLCRDSFISYPSQGQAILFRHFFLIVVVRSPREKAEACLVATNTSLPTMTHCAAH